MQQSHACLVKLHAPACTWPGCECDCNAGDRLEHRLEVAAAAAELAQYFDSLKVQEKAGIQ